MTTPKDSFSQALKFLSRKDYSEFMLKNKFEKLGINLEEYASIIEKLKKNNFLNDQRFKKNLVRKLIHKGYSPSLIQEKTDQQGVPLSKQELDSIYTEEGITPQDQIRKLIEKKMSKRTSHLEVEALKRRILNFILSKGHDYEEVSNQIQDIL